MRHWKSITFFLLLLFFPINALQVSDLSFLEKMKPGERRQLAIKLFNDRAQAETVDLKLCDYGCNCEGSHFFETAGMAARSNRPWIRLHSHREQLLPKEETTIYLDIAVPNDPLLKGSYWSVLLIEPAGCLGDNQDKPLEGVSFNVKIRFACHIVTDVSTGLVKLKIVDKQLRTIEGKELLCIDTANEGETFLNPSLILKLYDGAGKLQRSIQGSPERLYPGFSQRYHLDGEGLRGKKFNAFLVLDSGDNKLFCDSFSLYFP